MSVGGHTESGTHHFQLGYTLGPGQLPEQIRPSVALCSLLGHAAGKLHQLCRQADQVDPSRRCQAMQLARYTSSAVQGAGPCNRPETPALSADRPGRPQCKVLGRAIGQIHQLCLQTCQAGPSARCWAAQWPDTPAVSQTCQAYPSARCWAVQLATNTSCVCSQARPTPEFACSLVA